jgi:hypothetical protein
MGFLRILEKEKESQFYFGRSDLKGRWWLHNVVINSTLGFVKTKEKQEVKVKEVILRLNIG